MYKSNSLGKILGQPKEKNLQKRLSEEKSSIKLKNFNEFEANLKHLHSLADDKTIMKSIFFTCYRCDGPLVPNSMCVVCKRTSTRTCQDCGLKEESGNHVSC